MVNRFLVEFKIVCGILEVVTDCIQTFNHVTVNVI